MSHETKRSHKSILNLFSFESKLIICCFCFLSSTFFWSIDVLICCSICDFLTADGLDWIQMIYCTPYIRSPFHLFQTPFQMMIHNFLINLIYFCLFPFHKYKVMFNGPNIDQMNQFCSKTKAERNSLKFLIISIKD